MKNSDEILKSLPPYSASGEGISEIPLIIPQRLKIYYANEQNWHGANRYFCHGNYILILVLSGCRTLSLEEMEIKLMPGDAVVIPPFVRHAMIGKVEPFAELKASFFLPSNELRLKEVSTIRFRMKKSLQKKYLETARNFHAWYNGDVASGDECICNFALLLRRIVAELSDEMPREIYRHADFRRLSAVVEYLAANRDHKVSLKEISGALFLSGSTIRQLFKRQMHTSLGHYELSRRLSRGVEILRSSDMTASEVAPLVGFESASSFLRALRRETGATSRELRKSAKKMPLR